MSKFSRKHESWWYSSKFVNRFEAIHSPQERPDPSSIMHKHSQPEDDLKGRLPSLVMEETLSDITTGPASKEVHDMQHVLSQPPTAVSRTILVEAIEAEGEKA
jgi:hypothetical protein